MITTMKLQKLRPTSTVGDGGPSGKPSTFGALEEQLSLLDIRSAPTTKQRPTTPPPPYPESDAPTDLKAGKGLKVQETRETVVSSTPGHETPSDQAADDAVDAVLADKATTLAGPPSPGPATPFPRQFPRLPKPVAIPRVNPGLEMPYTRAWAPSLASHAITLDTFLAFIDGLNAASLPPPPIKALEIAAYGLQCTPVPYAGTLGSALQLAALAGTLATSHGGARRYLAAANGAFFAPRGLHASRAGTRRVLRLLGAPAGALPLAPVDSGLGAQERRLRGAAACGAAELVTEGLPGPPAADGAVARLAAWRARRQVVHAEESAARGRRRAERRKAGGKKARDGWVEKSRVRGLEWVVIRNLEDVEREREEKKARAARRWSVGEGLWSPRGADEKGREVEV